MLLRKRQLEGTFRRYYEDLLKAITSDNYEALEILCESAILMELAAKMYEFEKYKGIQFRIAKSNFKSEYEIQVLNHFYVKNVSINRSENPTLKNYKMV